MMVSARSPDCIHDNRPEGRRQPASSCINCLGENAAYQRWCAFWDALPYVWQWDKPEPGALFFSGHWAVRETGERVVAEIVLAHLRGEGVTVVDTWP